MFKKGDTVMFKKGDEVECIDAECTKGQLVLGRHYEVARVCENGCGLDLIDTDRFVMTNWNSNRFRLVTKDSELEELVKTANAGYRAVEKLYTEHIKNIEWKNSNTPNWNLPREDGVGFVNGREIRVKLKPKFELLFVARDKANWLVELRGDRLYIGCQEYDAEGMRIALKRMCGSERVTEVSRADGEKLLATRFGIKHGTYAISWEDADRILAALEKAGV